MILPSTNCMYPYSSAKIMCWSTYNNMVAWQSPRCVCHRWLWGSCHCMGWFKQEEIIGGNFFCSWSIYILSFKTADVQFSNIRTESLILLLYLEFAYFSDVVISWWSLHFHSFFCELFLQLPRYPNSIASLSYNHTGELLAVASSYTYQEANEL